MLEIEVTDETNTLTSAQLTIAKQVLTHAAAEENVSRLSEVSVTFVDEKEIQSLNATHRGLDKATDVLSFALHDGEEEVDLILPEGMSDMLGDIVISVPHIERQASEYGHTYERELAFLLVHGFLHLLGYDHMNETDEKKMFTRQEEILQSYGLGRPQS
ncbi:rRNA maturation RNase YbeY [Bacillus sp. FSL W7-1360]